jgi:peptidyl-prolyl cis-trans isomerase C
MKNLIKTIATFLLVFVGLNVSAASSHFLNPNLDVTEVRASHVLVKTRKEAVQIKKDIESGKITFEQAAEQYSLCPSGQYGGDLGYFNRKQMVQQFADTAFDLKVGEISDPVGTKFGWHIIKTTAKR